MARFYLNKRMKLYRFDETFDPTAALTAVALQAGTDCIGAQGSEELENIRGFILEPSDIPMPGYSDITVPTLPGEQSFASSILTYYEDDTTKTIETLFGDGTNGYLAFARQGAVAGQTCNIFGYQVGSNVPRPDRSTVALFDVNLSVTSFNKDKALT